MLVQRTFHPVGQGAFYTEEHLKPRTDIEFRVVYDCGGSSGKIVKDEIDRKYRKNEQIDAVFISHFHQDHINGLEYLLSRCDVKKVFIPSLTDSLKALYVAQNELEGSAGFYNTLILSPEEVLDTEVCTVEEFNPEEELTEEELSLVEGEFPKSIKSGVKLTATTCGWVYVPFQIANYKVADEFMEQLNLLGVNVDNIVNKLKEKDKRQAIIRAYKEVLKFNRASNLNANSLCVYSGLGVGDKRGGLISIQNKSFDISDRCGCLYTGDFEANNTQNLQSLLKGYLPYWDLISTVQIPHHGSKENYSDQLISKDVISLVSAEPGAKYYHPDGQVVKALADMGSKLHLVTLDRDTEVKQYISYNRLRALSSISLRYEKVLARMFPEYVVRTLLNSYFLFTKKTITENY
ncbi:MBL fold metallo-hydrolase [Hydrogenovibrio thermophilus]|uniref:MBL fold metallo-hydrolase n=1 Tax=Hydrogenovibrio thermophilus TaxID=265883 RepID=A0A451G4M1_9GAMM|nr:MBL fold metallo-hydrolase [Hydrogenovibrio thermophilus]QAB14425.1 MBL fold metallo-hydrolase [Hydrogenovibrio thermophilus]